MKQHPLLIVVALTSTLVVGSFLCTCVTADNPDDRAFGNGRFLRRLRDDAAKRKKAEEKKQEARKEAKKASAIAKRQSQASRAPSASVAQAQKQLQAAKRQTRSGFGMQIDSKNDKLIVTKVDSKGNAVEAGIRKGDVLVAAGGVEFQTVDELNEISKILGNGDQLEFEISRRGQKKKVLIQYGEAPAETEEVVVNKPQPLTRKVGDYNFLPEPAQASNSVLNTQRQKPASSQYSSVPRLPKYAQPNANGLTNTEAQAIIEQQRYQIELLKHEIQRLRNNQQTIGSGLKAQRAKWNPLTGPKN